MKKIITLLVLCVFIGCRPSHEEAPAKGGTIARYSPAVKDTFYISISLPNAYDPKKQGGYPVIYLLDANLYFDIMATTVNKYADVGLLAPAIVVGIGYKDFKTLDSLRDRDLTYPLALPEYGMAQSGKGDKFLAFIKSDIIPYMDATYATNQDNRVLMGHSLAGYFTLYALQQSLTDPAPVFTSYIAASPSVDYNHNYLLSLLDRQEPEKQNPVKVYITFGGLEDAEEGETDELALKSEEKLLALTTSLNTRNNIRSRGDLYTNLGHMDMPLPTFVRGLQWALNMTE